MFSLLCRGYGTYDGTAKSEPNPNTPEHKEYFTLDDLHLPPINSPLQKAVNRSFARSFHDDQGPRYENKAFKLPSLSTKTPTVPLSKTYSTKRGALVLYSETNALPGSPKARKRRRKYKKPQPLKLKTIGDLRDLVLSYKNGGDPLFLSLLQKRLSATNKERAVRPGFSPKRYIATLGRNSLQQDRWDKLASSGSFRDPALLSYNPGLPAIHKDGSDCELFSGKPQPYSTMSLPPISPSSSMFEGSFQFYKNAMSTGAASMITVDSEEYAPSSRAVSPAESLEGRLDEVEPLPTRRNMLDPYAMLNEKQKADLLSRLLVQGTLESMDSDLEAWVSDLSELTKMEQEPLAPGAVTAGAPAGRPRLKHKGSVRSGSLTSVPRLPPIYSAGARPSSPVESQPEDSSAVKIPSAGYVAERESGVGEMLDPSAVTLDFDERDRQSSAAHEDAVAGTELKSEIPHARAAEQINQDREARGADLGGCQGDPETSVVAMVTPASGEESTPAPAASARSGSARATPVEDAAPSPVSAVAKETPTAADDSPILPAAATTLPPLPPNSPVAAPAAADLSAEDFAPVVTMATAPLITDPATADQDSNNEDASSDTTARDKEVSTANDQQNNTENTMDGDIAFIEDVIIDATTPRGEQEEQEGRPAGAVVDGSAGVSTAQNDETEAHQHLPGAEQSREGEAGDEKGADSIAAREQRREDDDDDAEDEGIGTEGEETDEEREEVLDERAEHAAAPTGSQRKDSKAGSRSGALPTEEVNSSEETRGQPEPNALPDEGGGTDGEREAADPPPAISLDELHGQAKAVARKVLARPQSGMVFMEDVRNAVTMWADRLSTLLGPPPQLQEARISSAGPQRTPSAGKRRDRGALQTGPPVRHRKMSRSAGPSMAFLRNALLISRGDLPDVETLRKLPPLHLPSKFEKPSRSRRTSGVVPPGHIYREPNDADSISSGDPAKSIESDRVSNSDLQMDIFSFVASEEVAMIERLQAEEILEDEVTRSDEFRAAVSAVVNEAQQNVVPVKSATNLASPPGKLKRRPSEKEVKKRATPPFTVPRPAEPKPPPGLKNKEAPVNEKSLHPSKKKAPAAKKKGTKAEAKQSKTKPVKPPTKNKAKKEKAEAVKSVDAKGQKFEVVQEQKPDAVVRVDSETGEADLGVHVEAPVSEVVSTVPSSQQSPEPSTLTPKHSTSPTGSISTHVNEVPRLAPRSPEPEVVSEAEVAQEEELTKEAQEAAAKQLERQERAARRAAERAAAAERRRQEVERKRREREEAKRRAAEEEERLERLKQEQEEEMRRRGEERRRNREEKEAESRRREEEEKEEERRRQAKLEHQKRMRDAWRQKQEEVLAQRKLEEELRREQERIDAELEMARIREEEERLKAMEEWEREELMEKMRQEEELLRQRLEEQKLKEEEERRVREEQRRKQAEALALLRQQQLQRHLFLASLFKEHHYLALNQRFTRAFTFSYFQLLPWLYLNSLKPPDPILKGVKQSIPTIVEEADKEGE